MKITKDKWTWMPHAAHFICGSDCKFFLATKVGKYIVSTVGEYLPDSQVREIYAQSRGYKLEGIGDARKTDFLKKNNGYEEIGHNRKYETMVFKAIKSPKCQACPFTIESGNNIDQNNYNEQKEAFRGHYKMCIKYANK